MQAHIRPPSLTSFTVEGLMKLHYELVNISWMVFERYLTLEALLCLYFVF